MDKSVEYFDQQLGEVHPRLCNKDVKFMKICTIILICMMTLALKVLAMFTFNMGALISESAIFIYGWMPAHMALVATQWLPIAVILIYMVIKTKWAYYKLIIFQWLFLGH